MAFRPVAPGSGLGARAAFGPATPPIPFPVAVSLLHASNLTLPRRFQADMVLALAVTVLVRAALSSHILEAPEKHKRAAPAARAAVRPYHALLLAAAVAGCLGLLWWLGVLGKPVG